ncbi:MAG: crossover junction endodeoxyribonuclease RuvC [Nitrospira sp.]|nr:crossover junction endodeoxyribonuclease RuvC [Nitrospira sp.]
MRVLGIDPGTRATGYGIVGEEARRIYFVGAGTIKTSGRFTLPKRLRQIFEGLTQVISDFQPDAIAVENTFLSNNFATALKLGQACGVALLSAELSGLKVYDYTPSQVKMAVVGHGAAEKEQVQRMVDYLLGSKGVQRDGSHHASDALAVAICHLHSRNLREMEISDAAPEKLLTLRVSARPR